MQNFFSVQRGEHGLSGPMVNTPLQALSDRKVDVVCIQETRWKGSGCKFYEAKGKRHKLFWMGGEERSDGVSECMQVKGGKDVKNTKAW